MLASFQAMKTFIEGNLLYALHLKRSVTIGHVCIQWNTSEQILPPALKFKVSTTSPHPLPPRLFWVVPDVTWAESLSECTFHGNEVRVMVRPGAKRSAWNTKRRTPWKPWPDSTEQRLVLVHRKTFIKTVCVREK